MMNKHNCVKNPNWQGGNQLAIYKRSQEVKRGATITLFGN